MKDYVQGTTILLHGHKKVGKTTLAVSFPKPVVVFATEPGHRYVSKIKGVKIIKVYNKDQWTDHRQFIRNQLKATKAKTVVIDTTNTYYQVCSSYVCGLEGKSYPTEIGSRGLGWDKVRRELLDVLNDLAMVCEEMKATQIFICHSKSEELEYRTITLTKQTYSLQLQPDDIVAANVDNIWYLDFPVEEEANAEIVPYRTLWLKGNANIRAESRDPALKIGRIKRLKPDTAYKQIVKAFYISHHPKKEDE